MVYRSSVLQQNTEGLSAVTHPLNLRKESSVLQL